MINLKHDSVIYIFCPAQNATGGTELLHQLVDQLRKFKYRAKIYYVPKVENPTADRFEKYDIEISKEIIDSKKNVIIVPEVLTEHIVKFKNIQKVIWWLSVDFYYLSMKTKRNRVKRLFGLYKPYKFDNKDKIIHLVQSYYAYDFLLNKGLKDIGFLSDYINEDYMNKNINYCSDNRENICFYNPKKGYEFTKLIIEASKNYISWIPLENMSIDKIKELLNKGKVYVDFGNHPGKDRFPREAAISGCCIITGKQGAAKFYRDIPICDEYKFDDIPESIPMVIDTIKKCFNNYDDEIKKFENYREMIIKEKDKFSKDILNVFKKEC